MRSLMIQPRRLFTNIGKLRLRWTHAGSGQGSMFGKWNPPSEASCDGNETSWQWSCTSHSFWGSNTTNGTASLCKVSAARRLRRKGHWSHSTARDIWAGWIRRQKARAWNSRHEMALNFKLGPCEKVPRPQKHVGKYQSKSWLVF